MQVTYINYKHTYILQIFDTTYIIMSFFQYRELQKTYFGADALYFKLEFIVIKWMVIHATRSNKRWYTFYYLSLSRFYDNLTIRLAAQFS